jgi:hypothetical protein
MNAPEHFAFDPSGMLDDSVLLTVMVGSELRVDMDTTIGWEPLGLPFHVTKARGNYLIELDGRPAAEIYERFLHIDRSRQDNAGDGYEFPLMLRSNDYDMLRSAVHIEPDGSLDLHGFVEEGTDIYLSYGNPTHIVADVNKRLEAIARFRPEAILLYSCVVRKAFWHDFVNVEMEPFERLAPTVGFHSWGEITRDPVTGHLLEHNVSMLSVALREGDVPEGDYPTAQVDDTALR